jgi:hypothetical protein
MGELLARFMELRAWIKYPRIGTPERRVMFAQARILADRPKRIAVLDRLSKEYVELKNTIGDCDRLRVLETQIRTLDGQLCINDRGPALIVGILHYFFRCGYNSAETSVALDGVISPVGVRQIASRLEKLWQKMQSGQDCKPTKREIKKAERRVWWTTCYRAKQIEQEKAERDAETPEARAVRLEYQREYHRKNRDRVRAQRKANWKSRDLALAKYRAATPEQIEERKRKRREYLAKHKERDYAAYRRRYALKVASMTPEARAARTEQFAAISLQRRMKQAATRIEKRQSALAASIAAEETRRTTSSIPPVGN